MREISDEQKPPSLDRIENSRLSELKTLAVNFKVRLHQVLENDFRSRRPVPVTLARNGLRPEIC